jgi:hypothetical protein
MREPSALIRDAYPDDPLDPAGRDRLWSTMQHRQTRNARVRNLVRAGALLVAGAIIAAVAFLRSGGRSMDRRLTGPVVIAADSLTTNSPPEPSMIQEIQEPVPSNLIPLLGHRSSLRTDIVNFEQRQNELVRRVNQTTGREHDAAANELVAVEHQLESSRLALSIIDRELAGHESIVTHTEVAASSGPQVIQIGGGPMSTQLMWAAGGAGGLLLLGMLTMLVYMRRIVQSTRAALSLVEGQVSSQHATLAAGIDAIALEVERLGEGQRFMSKVLAGPEGKARLRD